MFSNPIKIGYTLNCLISAKADKPALRDEKSKNKGHKYFRYVQYILVISINT